MRGTMVTVLALAFLGVIWGCGSKDSGSAPPAAAPATGAPGAAPPASPGGPPTPGTSAAPGMTPGGSAASGAASAGASAPQAAAPSAEGAKPAEKSGEAQASKKADDSDDPFSSSSAPSPEPAKGESGKATVAGALGKAFLRAAGAPAPGNKGGK